MRITTQMLNRSAQRAGLPTNRTSLLNYIHGNNSNVSLANALSKTNQADATKKTDYEKLEKSADQTAASTDRLLSAGSENVTASDLQNFVDKYNDMLKNLGKSSNTLNLFYAQTAKDTVTEYKQELAGLGITVAKDGTLSFAKSGFEKTRAGQESAAEENTASEGSAAASTASGADALFAKESGFFSKLNYLASRVSDYADANAGSYSDYYNAAGSRTGAYSNGKYNFWS
ncbi:MAG: hypothetical protein NC121_19050 [Blautia sp.]|nr:hypothetical protein [Blautia sp.]